MNTYLSTKLGRTLFSVVLFMAIVALAAFAQWNYQQSKQLNNYPAQISVMGTGEVIAIPDIGQFSFSVEAKGEDAATAQEMSGTKINDILAYLKEQGIEEKDIKTQNYNLYPQYRYEERVCAFNSYCPPGEQIADGFQVSQSVSVKVRDTEKAGAIIAGVGEKGATNISNLNFTIDDMEALKNEAKAKAISDAKAKADVLAKELGVKIVRLVGFYENEDGYNPQPYYAREMSMDSVSNGFGGAEMPTGEQSTKVTVNISYEIR